MTATGSTSDGLHTFDELYRFRLLYNAALFNEWAISDAWTESYRDQPLSTDHNFEVHKSTRHNDGELCFGGGWFIVMAQLPTGQISNHYELKDWHLFNIPERDVAAEWDGHTAADVANRLTSFLESNAKWDTSHSKNTQWEDFKDAAEFDAAMAKAKPVEVEVKLKRRPWRHIPPEDYEWKAYDGEQQDF